MNLPAPSPPTCPKCSRPLASGALEGNCPTCLLGLATAVNLRAAPASRTSPAFRRYELLEKLAPGSVGVAWRARHRELGREVVLKMVDIDELGSPALLERFRLEAGAAARLEHPNIVPVLEAGEMDGRYLYTMPPARSGMV